MIKPERTGSARGGVGSAGAGRKRILIVEDEDAVRNLAKRILESSGYTVLTASNGNDAILACERNSSIQLIVTDVIMPRMSGRELADRLHLSPGYLLRLFKSSTGMPPMTYLARRRVETAAGLLLHTDQSVTQIGRSVGWRAQIYFARRFKAHFGLSATTYRSRFADRTRRLQTWLERRSL